MKVILVGGAGGKDVLLARTLRAALLTIESTKLNSIILVNNTDELNELEEGELRTADVIHLSHKSAAQESMCQELSSRLNGLNVINNIHLGARGRCGGLSVADDMRHFYQNYPLAPHKPEPYDFPKRDGKHYQSKINRRSLGGKKHSLRKR